MRLLPVCRVTIVCIKKCLRDVAEVASIGRVAGLCLLQSQSLHTLEPSPWRRRSLLCFLRKQLRGGRVESNRIESSWPSLTLTTFPPPPPPQKKSSSRVFQLVAEKGQGTLRGEVGHPCGTARAKKKQLWRRLTPLKKTHPLSLRYHFIVIRHFPISGT